MTDKPRVLLIDLSALFHPAWHANENGPVSVAFQATIGAVHRCLTTVPTELVAICCDGRGNWRKELAGHYKAHREKLPESFYGEFARVKDRLRADGLLLWECDGFEADDVIATACLEAHGHGHDVTIATGDKDLAQLVCEQAEILNTRTWDTWTAATVEAKFGVPPARLGDWLALVGDSSDGVKGCPGCGPKRATELLTKCGNLATLLSTVCQGGTVATPALQKALAENVEQIKLARKLVALNDRAPIEWDKIYEHTNVDRSFVEMSEFDAEKGSFALVKQDEQTQLAAAQEVAPMMTQKNLDEQYFFGFAGASSAPFPENIRTILKQPVDPKAIEIRPDGVVYLPGVVYRRLLNNAFGPGGWALLPRSKWIKIENTIAWHGALVCLGQFVAEAVGECFYRENNETMSMVSCIEGAKTDCLSRCCKDLGAFLELWDKNYTDDFRRKFCETYRGEKWYRGNKVPAELWRLKQRTQPLSAGGVK